MSLSNQRFNGLSSLWITGLPPDGRHPVGQLGVRLPYVHYLRRNVAQDAQRDDPIQYLMVARVLQFLRGEVGQLAALALPDQLQITPVGLQVNGAAAKFVGQETVGPA